MNLFRKKAKVPEPEPEPEPLAPGLCECGHVRCAHIDGKGKCNVSYPHDEQWPNGAKCACQIYIFDPDADDDDDDDDDEDNPENQPTPDPSELEPLWTNK